MPQFQFNNEDRTNIAPGTGQPFGGELVTNRYKHNIIDTSVNNLSTILTSIAGSSYNVDYYSQRLSSSDELRAFDPGEVSAYRQYQVIKNYEFKLQAEISKSYDDKDNRLTATGTAITYPGLIPNKFDMFIGDIGDGLAGLFTITRAVKKTYFQQTCHEIDFELMYILDASLEKSINAHVVETTHFVKDYISFGANPVLVDERYNASKTMQSLLTDTLAEYLSEFYSYEYNTLLVPCDQLKAYDPFLVSFLLMIFDVNDHPLLSKIKQYNTDDPNMNKYINIWNVLLKQQSRLLDNCFTHIQLIPVKMFSTNPMLQTVAYSGLDRIVLPITTKKTIDDVLQIGRLSLFVDNFDESLPTQSPKAADGEYTIPTLDYSSCYLFTDEFYRTIQESENVSDFENLVKKFLNKQNFDYKEVIGFTEMRDTWTRYQRCYLLPVLFLLLIYKIRSI